MLFFHSGCTVAIYQQIVNLEILHISPPKFHLKMVFLWLMKWLIWTWCGFNFFFFYHNSSTAGDISITCTFLLMRYAFTALQAVYIDDRLRVYIYAKELYMGSKHLPHFIFSVIILICAVCYMIVNFMLLLQNNNGNNRAGFKRAQSKVTILVYVACFLIVMVFIVFLPKYFQGMCTSILFLLMTFFISILKTEYEEERGGVNVAINRNYFSFYSLINMSCLTALTLAYGNLEGIYCPKITLSWECKFLFVIIGILFYIPLFGLMVYVVYQYVNEPIRDCCRRNEYNLVGKRKHLFSSLFI